MRRAPVVSGEALSATLGISRAAVWKHVEALRAAGYRIEARRARGYALTGTPDRLLPAEIARHLTTERFGRRLECFETIDSTNVHAARLARDGRARGHAGARRAPDRRSRPPRPAAGCRRRASTSTRASSCGRASHPPTRPNSRSPPRSPSRARWQPLAPGRVAIKWPNDCLLDGKKVAGILTEMDAEVDRMRAVVARHRRQPERAGAGVPARAA